MRNLIRIACVSAALVLLITVRARETPVAHAATITVNSTDDIVADDGFCTLREAIIAANTDTASGATAGECPAGSGADTITLAEGATYALTTRSNDGEFCVADSNGSLCVDKELTIDGNGAIIMRISGPGILVFAVFGSLTINDATISGGRIIGGILIGADGSLELNDSVVSGNDSDNQIAAGGITNFGTAVLNNSAVIQNTADISIDNETPGGGGIRNGNGATITLNNSTVSGNLFQNGSIGAGGISNEGALFLNSSTVSRNSVISTSNLGLGGGIFNSAGTATLNSSTVSGNSVNTTDNVAGGVAGDDGGELILNNTIVAGNLDDEADPNDCLLLNGGIITSQGYNLIGDASNCAFTLGTGDQIGTAESPIDAMLVPLDDNGGPTETHALAPGSPALDAGSCNFAFDQRGQPRPIDAPGLANADDGCDMGALEAQLAVTTIIPNGDVDGLRDALGLANSAVGLNTIQLAENGNYMLEDGELVVKTELLIEGNGATIERSSKQDTPEFRILHVTPTGDLTLNDTTITNGLLTDSGDSNDGGGIWNEGENLSVNNSTIFGNTALNGGGIFNEGGALNLNQSDVDTNDASEDGGGIFNDGGTLTVTDSDIDGNDASEDGGGIFNDGGEVNIDQSVIIGNGAVEGGGIFNNGGVLELIDSTVTGNIAGTDTQDGFGGGILSNGVSMTITGSTISENEANAGNGGIIADGTLEITNSTISGNLFGGLLVQSNANASLVNSSIINNLEGPGIAGQGSITLANSIMAHHSSEFSSDCQFVNNLTSNGFNIDTDGSCNLTHDDDLPVTIPFVGSLVNNGGPTRTHSLTEGSPAIDAIPVEDCVDGDDNPLTTDQRGIARPQGEGCDIGAFEAAPILLGDFDCDGIVTIFDAIFFVRLIVSLPATLSTCGGI